MDRISSESLAGWRSSWPKTVRSFDALHTDNIYLLVAVIAVLLLARREILRTVAEESRTHNADLAVLHWHRRKIFKSSSREEETAPPNVAHLQGISVQSPPLEVVEEELSS